MKNYLDPVYLVVNEDTWKTRVYAEIFASLVEIIDYIEEVEKDSNSLYKLVKFKFSYELFSKIYHYNPFKNEPSVENFYVNLFNDLLSKLTRRIDWCPINCEIKDSVISAFSCTNSHVPDEVLSAWESLINQCVSCSNYDQDSLLRIISPLPYQTKITLVSEQLINIDLKQIATVYELFDISQLLQKETINDKVMRKVINICYHQAVLTGRMNPNLTQQEYIFDSNFWRTIDSAEITEEDTEYKLKFIDSLTQVVYAQDIDIRLHTHQAVKITIDKKKYTKKSADVFQMGRGTIDRRCSRIFFCKINNQICFYEFDPDFHAGE
jgi:hypothetical protein